MKKVNERDMNQDPLQMRARDGKRFATEAFPGGSEVEFKQMEDLSAA